MDTVNVTRADGGEHWLVGGDVTTIKASGQDTSGDLLVLDVTVSSGGGPRSYIGTGTRRSSSFRKASSRSARRTRTTR
jgi:hypothetical protein